MSSHQISLRTYIYKYEERVFVNNPIIPTQSGTDQWSNAGRYTNDGISITRGTDSYWSIGAFLAFLL